MYEGGLRVPASITWPGKVKAGTTSGQVNLLMDIYSTLIEVAGVKSAHPLDGRSFLPTLLGKQLYEEDRSLYFTRREGGTKYGGQCIYALRLGDWKLLHNTQVYKKLNNQLMLHMQERDRVPLQKPEKHENFK